MSADGSTVYAAVFHSGNQTTALDRGRRLQRRRRRVARPCTHAGGCRRHAGRPAGAERELRRASRGPEVGLIVKFDPAASQWEDELGRNWNNAVRFDLPDLDVFAIDAERRARRSQTDALRARRHGALQHGREPGEREGLRQQHRGAERGPLRRPGHRSAHDRARPSARGAHHRPRRRDRRAAPPEQAHRLRSVRTEPGRASRTTSLATPLGMAVDERRRDALRRRLRLEQGRRLRHRRSSRTTRFVPNARDHIARQRRRADRPRARRGATTASTCSRASTTRSRSSTRRPATEIAHLRSTTRSRRERRRRPAVPLRRALHLEQRRGVVRELPHLRRLRQPRLGPRQPRRRRARRTRTRSGSRSARQPRRLPSAEGPDDDAEPARHGEPRPDALARRPHRRQRSRRRRARRGRSRSRSSTSPSTGLLGRDERELDRRRHAGVHRLHPRGDAIRRTRSATSTTRSRAAQQAGREPLLRRRVTDVHRELQRLPHARSRRRASSARDGDTSFENETQEFKIAAPAQPVPEGRHVRHAGRSPFVDIRRQRRTRATRSAASASCTTAASTRVFRFLQRDASSSASNDDASARDARAVHARLRHRPGADRRPADHARRRRTPATVGTAHRPAHRSARHRLRVVDHRRARVRPRREGHGRRRARAAGSATRTRTLPERPRRRCRR